jgi:hypothetical protein
VADLFHQSSAYFPDSTVLFYVQVVCTVLMLPLLFLFVLNFPRPMPWTVRHPRLQWLAFSASLLFGAVFIFQPQAVPLQLALESFNVLATAVILAATFVLWRTEARSPSGIERQQAGYLLIGFLPAFAATGAITLLGYAFGPLAAHYQQPLIYYIDPPLELIAAAVTAFAILKYRLLDFELKVRGGMRYVVLTLILGTFFFVVEVYVGNFILQNRVFSFLGPYGSAGLAGAAGLVLFKPVHKLSGKVTDKLFPDAAGPKVDYERQRSREIYQAQATHVLRDARVTDREMAFLHTLRDQLGLSAAEAEQIEESVETTLGVDSDRTGQVHIPAPLRVLRQAPPPPAAPPVPPRPPANIVRPATPAPRAPAKAAVKPAATAPKAPARAPAKAAAPKAALAKPKAPAKPKPKAK